MTRILTDQIYVVYDQLGHFCESVLRLLGLLGNTLEKENVEERYFEKEDYITFWNLVVPYAPSIKNQRVCSFLLNFLYIVKGL